MIKTSILSRTAQSMLAAAAARDDHLALPPEHLAIAARRAVVQSLLKHGLLEEIVAGDDGLAWRKSDNGERLTLRATQAGLKVAGSTPTRNGEVGDDTPANAQTSAFTSTDQPTLLTLPTANSTAAQHAPAARPGLRATAQGS